MRPREVYMHHSGGNAAVCGRGPVNVGKNERQISVTGGSALLAAGVAAFRKRNFASAAALSVVGGMLLYRGATGRCSLYGALGVSTAGDTELTAAVTINKPRDEVYCFWRELTGFAQVVKGLDSVEVTGDRTSRWKGHGPANISREWESEITEELPGERLAWRTTAGSPSHEGSVTFRDAPGGRGTEVTVTISAVSEGIGRAIAMAPRVAEWGIEEGLARIRQYLETGEVATAGLFAEGGGA